MIKHLKAIGRFVITATSDLLRQKKILPRSEVVSFAFLIHPRSREDIYSHFSFFKIVPYSALLWILKKMWPIRVHKISMTINEGSLDGYTIAIPILPRIILENRELAKEKIQEAVLLSEQLGAKIIGLGALIPSVTRAGEDIERPPSVALTNGYTYTSLTIVKTLERIIKKYDIDTPKIEIAVVGAAGFIGRNTALLLAKRLRLKKLTLIDLPRKQDRIVRLKIKHTISNNINDIKKAHFVITATNAPQFVIKSEHLSPGTIILDDAQPSDVDQKVIKERQDIVVMDAALWHSESVRIGHNRELVDEHDMFSCLAETILLAGLIPEEDLANAASMGTEEKIELLEKLLPLTNFRIAEYQNSSGEISEQRLKRVIKILKQRLIWTS